MQKRIWISLVCATMFGLWGSGAEAGVSLSHEVILQKTAQENSADSMALSDVAVAPVVAWSRPIIGFRATLAGMSPQDRAEVVMTRLATHLTPKEWTLEPYRVHSHDDEGVPIVRVMLGTRILFNVAPGDGDTVLGESQDAVAQRALEAVQGYLAARVAAVHPATLRHGILMALLYTIVGIFLLALLWSARCFLKRHFHVGHLATVPMLWGVDVRAHCLVVIHFLIWLPAFLATLAVLYLWVHRVCLLFPYTQPWAEALMGRLMDFTHRFVWAILHAIPGVLTAGLIFLLTHFVSRGINSFLKGVEEGSMPSVWLQPETAKVTRRLISIVLWLFAIIVAYPYLPGSQSVAFKGVSVFAGLMLSLGSAGMVNQMMSGFVLVYSRAMRVGDLVTIGDTTGVVTDLGFLSTKIRNLREVVLPNAVVLGQKITNYSRYKPEEGMMVTATVTIGYDTPWRQVHSMLQEAAGRTSGIRKEPAGYVVQTALDDFYVAYELRAYCVEGYIFPKVQPALHENIQDVFNENGVQIMSPHFTGQPADAIFAKR